MNLTDGMLSVFPAHLCRGLPTGEQAVLAWLWHHKTTGSNGRLPSLNTLAAEAGMTKGTVINHIQSLRRRQFIRVWETKSEDNGTSVNHYDLALHPGTINVHGDDTVKIHGSNGRWDARIYLDIWKEVYGGYFNVTTTSRGFKKAEADFGKDVVIEAFKRYCKQTQAVFASPHRFFQTIGGYIKKLPKKVEYDQGLAGGDRKW